MTMSTVLLTVVLLKNPTFTPKRCGDSRFTIGSELPEKRELHRYGGTIIKIDRVTLNGSDVGFIYTTADGERFLGARQTTHTQFSTPIW